MSEVPLHQSMLDTQPELWRELLLGSPLPCEDSASDYEFNEENSTTDDDDDDDEEDEKDEMQEGKMSKPKSNFILSPKRNVSFSQQ